jgi:hypothetical protein
VSTSARANAGWLAALAGLLAVAAWLRVPGFSQGGFASHDVGGILYSAMVLHAGGLPYVDTVELKPPGCFYLAALLAGQEGRDIAAFQAWANAWALAGVLAVAVIGRRAFGPTAGLVAAGTYLLHDAHLDSMDANYVTWANLPQIVAVGAALEARRGGARARLWWAGAGAAAGLATLCKQPAGVVMVLVIAGAALGAGDARGRARRLAAVVGGIVLAHVPAALHYAWHGQLSALVDGYVANRWGVRYLTERSEGAFASEWALSATHFLALALVPAAFAAAAWRRASPAERAVFAWLVAWAVLGLAAAAVGARFYKGYYLASAAPLALAGAAPWGLLGERPWRRSGWRALACLGVGALALRAVTVTLATRDDRARPHDVGGRQVAAHIAAHTEPHERIWVWGWHLWDVYALSGRMSASRVYKSLGLLTPPNDDTWRRPASPLRFVGGDGARMLLEDLNRDPPAFIVLGSTVPHHDFAELRAFLRARYRRDRAVRLGKLEVWRRFTR